MFDACAVSRRNLFIYTRWVCLLLKVVFPKRDQRRAFIFVSITGLPAFLQLVRNLTQGGDHFMPYIVLF